MGDEIFAILASYNWTQGKNSTFGQTFRCLPKGPFLGGSQHRVEKASSGISE